jgi:hypothetical protein
MTNAMRAIKPESNEVFTHLPLLIFRAKENGGGSNLIAITSPTPTAKHSALHVARLFFLGPVALGTLVVDFLRAFVREEFRQRP